MALLFLDGFEEYGAYADLFTVNTTLLPYWGYSSASAPSLSTTVTRTAQNGISAKSVLLNCNGAGATFGYFCTPSTETFIIGMNYRTTAWTNRLMGVTQATTAPSGAIPSTGMRLQFNASGYIELVNNQSAAILATSAATYPVNAWYHIAMKYVYSNGAAGSIEVKVDDNQIINLTGINSSGNAAQINMIYFQGSNAGNINNYFDDIYICDGTGAINNNFLGPVGVYTLYPTAAGSSTQMTPSAGANYTCVDEMGANTTDYVTPSATAQVDLYTMSDLAGAPTQFNGVMVKTKAQRATTNNANLQLALKESGTSAYSSTRSVYTGAWLENFCVFETRPGGGNWDLASVNAIEAGLKSV